MKTYFLIIFSCLGIGLLFSERRDTDVKTTAQQSPSDALAYHVIISRDVVGFEDDRNIRLGAAGDQTAVIFVNDSPVNIIGNEGSLFCIDDFVVPGRNTVRIEGIRGDPSYMKVVRIDSERFYQMDWSVNEMIAKCRLDHTAKSNTLEFVAPDTIVPSKYEYFGKDKASKKALDEDTEEYLAKLEKSLRTLDTDSLIHLMNNFVELGRDQPSQVLSDEYDNRLQFIKEKKEFFEQHDLEIIESNYDRRKIDIYKGPRSILICRNVPFAPEGSGWVHPTPFFNCKVKNQTGETAQSAPDMVLLIKYKEKLYCITR